MQKLLEDITAHVKTSYDFSDAVSVEAYASLAETAAITYQDERGEEHTAAVELWNKPIQKALEEHKNVIIPDLGKDIFINEPIVMRSGYHLRVDAEQRILLAPQSNTVMVRNENVISGVKAPAFLNAPDTDIAVEGGIWDAMNYTPRIANNTRQRLDKENSVEGVLAMMLFSNVRDVILRGITFTDSSSYAVQICNCEGMDIEEITFVNYHKDGIHVNGTTRYGIIREMRGKDMGDDMVALNAWDWNTSAMTFGSIEKLLVENIHSKHNEFRLLPGRKTYPDGKKIDCDIRDCVIRNIEGVYIFKLYAQPNCSNTADCSEIVGNIENVYFDHIVFPEISHLGFSDLIAVGGLFEVSSDTTDLHLNHIEIQNTVADFIKEDMPLIKVGPLSTTWKLGSDNPADWREIMSPDDISTLKNTHIGEVSFLDRPATEKDRDILVRATHMTVNPDYPKTTPKGGNGYGIIENIFFEKF